MRALRAGGELAPRTIHNVYGDAHAMFRDAVVEELIEASPCVLPRGELPPKVDKDSEWRAAATYSLAEVERLISDPEIPLRSRRGATRAVAGRDELRHWPDEDRCDAARAGVTRRSRRSSRRRSRCTGSACTGARPGTDDLIVPARTMGSIAASDAGRMFKDDLQALRLRAWFITSCQ